MKAMILALLGLCFSILSGCSSKTIFVVYRDVPTNPSFVVIPANDYLDEVAFANVVEASIIRAGIKVVTRPGTKEVSVKKEAAQAQKEIDQDVGNVQSQTVEEKYFRWDDTPADYVVFTYSGANRVRFTKKSTREVFASFELPGAATWGGQEKADKIISEALTKLGLPVR
jgi:hypothetical protein